MYTGNRSVMTSVTSLCVVICCLASTSSARHQTSSSSSSAAAGSVNTGIDPCYRRDGSPTRCIPDFVNAAYERQILASSTCGDPPLNFCSQHPTIAAYHHRRQPQQYNSTAVSRDDNGNDDDDDERGDCVICDARHQHPASYLSDVNSPHHVTCWVSAAFSDSETNVSLTLSLHKKFEVSFTVDHRCHYQWSK